MNSGVKVSPLYGESTSNRHFYTHKTQLGKLDYIKLFYNDNVGFELAVVNASEEQYGETKKKVGILTDLEDDPIIGFECCLSSNKTICYLGLKKKSGEMAAAGLQSNNKIVAKIEEGHIVIGFFGTLSETEKKIECLGIVTSLVYPTEKIFSESFDSLIEKSLKEVMKQRSPSPGVEEQKLEESVYFGLERKPMEEIKRDDDDDANDDDDEAGSNKSPAQEIKAIGAGAAEKNRNDKEVTTEILRILGSDNITCYFYWKSKKNKNVSLEFENFLSSLQEPKIIIIKNEEKIRDKENFLSILKEIELDKQTFIIFTMNDVPGFMKLPKDIAFKRIIYIYKNKSNKKKLGHIFSLKDAYEREHLKGRFISFSEKSVLELAEAEREAVYKFFLGLETLTEKELMIVDNIRASESEEKQGKNRSEDAREKKYNEKKEKTKEKRKENVGEIEEENSGLLDEKPFNSPVKEESKAVFTDIFKTLPKNVILIVLLSPPKCETTARFANYIYNSLDGRIFNFSKQIAADGGLEHIIQKLSADATKANSEAVLIYKSSELDKNSIAFSSLILLVKSSQETCYKNLLKAKDVKRFSNLFRSYLLDCIKLLTKVSSEYETLKDKFEMLITEKLDDRQMNQRLEFLLHKKAIQRLGVNPVSQLDLEAVIKGIEQERSSLNRQGSADELKKINFAKGTFFKYASKVLEPCIKEIINLKFRSFDDFKRCTKLVNNFYQEFNLYEELTRATSTVMLKNHVMAFNKTSAQALCDFTTGFISHKNFSEEKDREGGDSQEDKMINEALEMREKYHSASKLFTSSRLCKVIIELLNHELLDSELINKEEFINLIVALLSHENALLNLYGQKILYQALSKRQKVLRSTIQSYDEKNDKPFAALLVENFLKLVNPLLNPIEKDLAKYIKILETCGVFKFKLFLVTGSKECLLITEERLKKLLELLAIMTQKFKEYNISAWILGLLAMLMQSSIFERKFFREYQSKLLSFSFECLNSFMSSGEYDEPFNNTTEFLNSLLLRYSNEDLFYYKYEEFDATFHEEKNGKYKARKKEKVQEPPPSKIADKSIQDFVFVWKTVMKSEGGEKDLLDGVQEMAELRQELSGKKMKLESVTRENNYLKRELEKENDLTKALTAKLFQADSEKNDFLRRIADLEHQLAESKKFSFSPAVACPLPSEKDPSIKIYDEDSDELLLVKNREEVDEQQAQVFINNLRTTREGIRELRSSICGALKFLGNDLYSSSTHFFYEIIQNAEDNQYSENCTPNLVFYLADSHILICNNEMGFLPKNVAAICQIGKSSKTGGISIGQKGLGFKSVFSCSDNPQVISKPWRFGFKVSPGNDEMQYITPRWLEALPEAVEEVDGSYQTKIYLPLKEGFSKEKRTGLIKEILDSFDSNILLNLRNLNEITVINEKNSSITIKRTINKEDVKKIGHKKIDNLSLYNVESKIIRIEKIIKTNGESKQTHEDFKVFTAEIEIPPHIKQTEAEFRSNTFTQIMLAFPMADKQPLSHRKKAPKGKKKHDLRSQLKDHEEQLQESESLLNRSFSVYSFLPLLKEKHGFKFVINCDWVLTTNRESIRENEWNNYVRDCLARHFLCMILEDSYLRSNIANFIPGPTANPWWHMFRSRIVEGLDNVENLIKIFNIDSDREFLIANPELEELVTADELHDVLPKYFIIDLNYFGLDESVFKSKKIKKLGVEHIFMMLKNEAKSFAESRTEKWWAAFFSVINKEKSEGNIDFNLEEMAVSSPIFLIRDNKSRSVIPNIKQLGKHSNVLLAKRESVKELSWRKDEVILLHAESNQESEFLIKSLELQEFSPRTVFEILNNIHLRLKSGGTYVAAAKAEVWQDLQFIKNHMKESQAWQNQSNSTKKVIVPASSATRTFIAANKAVLPFVLLNKIKREDVDDLRADEELVDEEFFDHLGFEEKLEWSDFLYSIEVKPVRVYHCYEYMFEGFEKFVEKSKCAQLAFKIMKAKPIIQSLAANMSVLDFNNERATINSLADLALGEESGMPLMKIPLNLRKFAQRLDVTVNPDINFVLKAFDKFISLNKTEDKDRYMYWLGKLREFEDEWKADAEILSELKSCFKVLVKSKFYEPSKVYIYEDKEDGDEIDEFSREVLSGHLDYLIISQKENKDLMGFASMLKLLGCQSRLTIDFFASALEFNEKTASNYISEDSAIRTKLSDKGLISYLNLFQRIERYFEIQLRTLFPEIKKFPKSRCISEEWEMRESLLSNMKKLKSILNSDKFPFELPLITNDYRIFHKNYKFQQPSVCIAYLNSYLLEYSEKTGNLFVFLHPEIARRFPHIVGYLEIEYLEMYSDVTLKSLQGKNTLFLIPQLSEELSKKFDLKGKRPLILKSIFAALDLNMDIGGSQTFRTNFQKFLLFNDIIYLLEPDNTKVNRNLVQEAVKAYFKEMLNRNIDESILRKTIETCFNKNRSNKDFIVNYDGFSSQSKKASCKDFLPSTAGDQGSQKSDFFEISLAQNAAQNADIKAPLPDRLKGEFTDPGIPYIVNNDEILEIGYQAEKYFFDHLNSIFGRDMHFELWRSSNRLRDFPLHLEFIDDSIGYDMEVIDKLNCFSVGQNKKCLFEVKGFKEAFPNYFFFSENEKKRADKCEKNESYFIVVVDNLKNPVNIRTHIFLWSALKEIIGTLVPDRFKLEVDIQKYQEHISKLENRQKPAPRDHRQKASDVPRNPSEQRPINSNPQSDKKADTMEIEENNDEPMYLADRARAHARNDPQNDDISNRPQEPFNTDRNNMPPNVGNNYNNCERRPDNSYPGNFQSNQHQGPWSGPYNKGRNPDQRSFQNNQNRGYPPQGPMSYDRQRQGPGGYNNPPFQNFQKGFQNYPDQGSYPEGPMYNERQRNPGAYNNPPMQHNMRGFQNSQDQGFRHEGPIYHDRSGFNSFHPPNQEDQRAGPKRKFNYADQRNEHKQEHYQKNFIPKDDRYQFPQQAPKQQGYPSQQKPCEDLDGQLEKPDASFLYHNQRPLPEGYENRVKGPRMNDNKQNESKRSGRESDVKYCEWRFRCDDGINCANNHPNDEKDFFKENKVDGKKITNNKLWKTVMCTKQHRQQYDMISCIQAHNVNDSFCSKCKLWGHLEKDCRCK